MVALDDPVAVAADPLELVLAATQGQVALAVQEGLLLALGVIEAQLVEAAAARRRTGLDPRHLVVAGVLRVGPTALVGRHQLGVVDTPDYDRVVRVALLEGDDDLVPDA